MRVIGYVRVSTEEQAREGVSLAAQEQKLRAYAELYELDLVEIIADAGQSARTLKRPGLIRALATLDGGLAEGLVIAKLDRLTRSVADWNDLIDRYFNQEAALFSVADQFDTRTAGGRLVLNVLISVAQWEREAIAERTAAAMQHLKAQGVALGPPTLGQTPEESETITRILELHDHDLSMREIAAILTQEGRRTKRGGKWAPETIRKILVRAGRTTCR